VLNLFVIFVGVFRQTDFQDLFH